MNISIKLPALVLFALILLQCNPLIPYESDSVSYSTKEYYDSVRNRKIATYIWQPSENILESKKHLPLVLFSHGTEGASSNYTWLTISLAEKGFIVVGVDHYNNTYYNKTAEGFVSVWDRPQDLSFVLSRLLEDKTFSANISRDKIAAVGHSAGGYSVLSIAGAVYSLQKMKDYSDTHPESFGVKRSREVAPDFFIRSNERAKRSYKDSRFKAIVALDPAMGPGIIKESLQRVDLPVLIYGCKQNDLQSYEDNALFYSKNTKGAKFVSLDKGEGHFIFLDRCNTFGNVAFRYICKDRVGIDRGQVHKDAAEDIYRFMKEVFDRKAESIH